MLIATINNGELSKVLKLKFKKHLFALLNFN